MNANMNAISIIIIDNTLIAYPSFFAYQLNMHKIIETLNTKKKKKYKEERNKNKCRA